jgi:2-oxoglutarate ferredoxin oxidoreductase subunit gamma
VERSAIFAGFGGQGILFAGQVVAHAGLIEGREVLWIPSYGPEMRGGTASCTVIIADEAIGSPVVDRCDGAVVMNPPSLAKFAPLVRPGGILVVNATLVEAESGRDDITEIRIPCAAVARDAGNESLANMAALGALIGPLPMVAPEAVRAALRRLVAKRPELLEAELRVFDAGIAFSGAWSSRVEGRRGDRPRDGSLPRVRGRVAQAAGSG